MPPLPAFTVTEAMWLAIIGGALSIATLIVKHLLDKSNSRIDDTAAEIKATKALVADVITWAFLLEAHITEGKPPPPPPRPASVIDFFTATFIERAKSTD